MSSALCLTLLAPARANPTPALTGGGAHLTVVRSVVVRGLEVGMPRKGPYARALALDALGKWQESLMAYRRAYQQFAWMAVRRPQHRHIAEGWMAKARYMLLQSHRLLQHRNQFVRSMAGGLAARLFDRADAMHQKYLAIRRFYGREPLRLRKRILHDYSVAVDFAPGNRLARLGYASFLHAIGQHAKARRVRRRLVGDIPKRFALEQARYLTAANKTNKAIAALGVALHFHRGSARTVYASNDFDRLRADRRFKRLLRSTGLIKNP